MATCIEKSREFGENPFVEDNTEPSLNRNILEGVTTRVYHPERMMKLVGQ